MQLTNSHYQQFQSGGRRSLLTMLAVGLFTQLLGGCDNRKQAFAEAGDPFPLPALGQLTNLAERAFEPDGKVLLVNFWATWCAPCRKEMPDLQRLSQTLDRERFAVIGVSVDGDVNLVREFLLQRGIDFVNFQDPDLAVANRLLGIEVFPTTYIVDRNGKILHRLTGERSWNRSEFEGLLPRDERAETYLSPCAAVGCRS